MLSGSDAHSPALVEEAKAGLSLVRTIADLGDDRASVRCKASVRIKEVALSHPTSATSAIVPLMSMARDPSFPVRMHALEALQALAPVLNEDHLDELQRLGEEEDRSLNRELIESILERRFRPVPAEVPDGEGAPMTSTHRQLRLGIIHLFATGTSLKHDQIFHVGGAIISHDQPPVLRDWIINPGRRITKRLTSKSRLTNPHVEHYPDWDAQRGDVQAFFNGIDAVLVFDLYGEREWVEKVVFRGGRRPPVVIDLLEMAHFFLPEQSFFDVETIGRRGKKLAGLSGRDTTLPRIVAGLVRLLEDIVVSIRTPLRAGNQMPLILTLLLSAADEHGPRDFAMMGRIARDGSLRWGEGLPQVRDDFESDLNPPSSDSVISALMARLDEDFGGSVLQKDYDEEVPLSPRPAPDRLHATERSANPLRVKEGFDHLIAEKRIGSRDKQREYAQTVADWISKGGRFAIEAGTGTGKSVGYLVPCCELIHRNRDWRAVVATATKNLQDQLTSREISNLTAGRVLYQNVGTALFKGKNNYLCLTPLKETYELLFLKKRDDPAAKRLVWLHFAVLCARCQGDIEYEAVSDRFRSAFHSLRDEVSAQEACTADLCRYGSSCVYPRVRQHAKDADLIVTNHFKLPTILDTIADRPAILIVDEADQFPDNYRRAIEDSLRANDVFYRFLQPLMRPSGDRRGLLEILLEEDESFRSYCQEVAAACTDIERHLSEVTAVARELAPGTQRWQRTDGGAASLINAVQGLRIAFEAACNGLGSLKDVAREHLPKRVNQVDRLLRRAETFASTASELATGYDTPDFAHLIEYSNKTATDWVLTRVPMNLTQRLQSDIYERFSTTVYTSATLYAGGSLDLFKSELGCSGGFDDVRQISSPFDFPKHVIGAICSRLPEFESQASKFQRIAWINEIANAIVQLTVPVYGRSLVLCTNTKEMDAIYQYTHDRLQNCDIEVYKQNGTSLLEINTFRAVEYSVLFGVDRFWTGVDFPGPTLSQVIVVRVPNPYVRDPLVEHRQVHMRNFWDGYYGPTALRKLRQGFGRLMRKETDRGLFVLLDSRVAHINHFARYENELPIVLERAEDVWRDVDEMPRFTRRGLAHLELTPEYEERKTYMAGCWTERNRSAKTAADDGLPF